jgi:phosphoribosylformylglycinamidine (FGAM) synthase PurS component
VRERRPDRETGFAERLNARLKGVTVSNMKCGEMWRLVVSAPDERQALAAVERMLVSRSRREGLLLNPHYQTYEVLATTRLDAAGNAAAVPAKE